MSSFLALSLLTALPLIPLASAYRFGWRGAAIAAPVGVLLVLAGHWLPGLNLHGGTAATIVVVYVELCIGLGVLAALVERRRLRLERLALTDDLTGLPNRRHARLWLERAFAGADRGQQLCVVFFDIDHFKAFNDRHGHDRGDVALQEFARVLQAKTREMDLSSRFGGDEFLSVILTGKQGALALARRVQATLEATPIDGDVLHVSVGIAEYAHGMKDSGQLLQAGDSALYAAKGSGRDCIKVAETRPFAASG